jgi:hypothetical protein
MDERERISFNFFWSSEEEGASASNGAARDGTTGRDGAFRGGAITREEVAGEGFALEGAFGD